MFVDIFNTDNRYEVIYTDPPWKQTKGGKRKCRPNQGKELDYNTITLEEIIEHQKHVMQLTSENHVCFMWTIDKFLPQTEQFMKELGYKLHARMIWDKENGIAPAFTVRYSHEYLLWFYKDKLLPINKDYRGKYTTVLREKSTKHSKKPICAYEMIENLYPNSKKIELYARIYKEGWDCWGNEVS